VEKGGEEEGNRKGKRERGIKKKEKEKKINNVGKKKRGGEEEGQDSESILNEERVGKRGKMRDG